MTHSSRLVPWVPVAPSLRRSSSCKGFSVPPWSSCILPRTIDAAIVGGTDTSSLRTRELPSLEKVQKYIINFFEFYCTYMALQVLTHWTHLLQKLKEWGYHLISPFLKFLEHSFISSNAINIITILTYYGIIIMLSSTSTTERN